MPDKYALAAALGNFGDPISILIWAWAPLRLTNPNNVLPDIEVRENSMTAYYFGEAVTSRVPYLFQVLTMVSIVAVF